MITAVTEADVETTADLATWASNAGTYWTSSASIWVVALFAETCFFPKRV
jgi:hypothetical protein